MIISVQLLLVRMLVTLINTVFYDIVLFLEKRNLYNKQSSFFETL